MRLRYSPEAREDLRRASQYIAFEFQNPKAAKDLVQRIMRDCAALKRFPERGCAYLKRSNGRRLSAF